MPPNAEPKYDKTEKGDKGEITISAPVAVADRKNTQLPSELSGVKKIIEEYRHESDVQKAKIKELEEELKELRESNRGLKKKIKKAQQDLVFAEDEIEELSVKLDNYERRKEKRRATEEQPSVTNGESLADK